LSDVPQDEAYRGAELPRDSANELNALQFLVERMINRASTMTMVRIEKVTNEPGDLKKVGRVDVTPLVNDLDGYGNPIEHETVHNLPYIRYRGGDSAILLDPVKGDVGIAVFADRDVSVVKKTLDRSNPGSRRRFDMADGVYLGVPLDKEAPKQYVRFMEKGIEVKDKNNNTALLNENGIKLTDKSGNKIVMSSSGIDLN